MEFDRKHNLIISGSNNAGGGIYNNVKINGDGRISGDFDCIFFKTNGKSDVNGNVSAKLTTVNGTSTILGNLHSDAIKINGNADIHGNTVCKELKVSGQMDINGSLTGEDINIRGMLSVRGDCATENFNTMGGFTIGGLLNADTIEISMFGALCQAKEIGGEKINVRKNKGMFFLKKLFLMWFHSEIGLVTETIEGDEIHLEYTKAKVVRGTRISIGHDCDIDLVEYTDSFHLEESSVVREYRKI